MKQYISSIITEQTNRALSLKRLIPRPLKFAELTGLSERCTRILDEQIEILTALQSELANREQNGDFRDIFRVLRICLRDISLVEYYGIAALYYQTPEIGFLNKIIFKIHQEIKLPFTHPSVCCTSNKYYYSSLFTNVIFVPLGESDFLLHLPDLYHEVGHYVLGNMETELRLQGVKRTFDTAISKVTDYYTELLKTKKREVGPEEIPMMIERVHSQWKSWIMEFFCDLFALYTLGPAYAWSHLHLTTKISTDIHMLSVILEQSHPSDESRMRILLEGLRLLRFDDQANQIQAKWNQLSQFWGQPSPIYQYAYPSSLLKEIAKIILEGLRESGFSVATPDSLSGARNGNEIRMLLNEAWDRFWRKSGEDFRKWEESQIELLHGKLQEPKAVTS